MALVVYMIYFVAARQQIPAPRVIDLGKRAVTRNNMPFQNAKINTGLPETIRSGISMYAQAEQSSMPPEAASTPSQDWPEVDGIFVLDELHLRSADRLYDLLFGKVHRLYL